MSIHRDAISMAVWLISSREICELLWIFSICQWCGGTPRFLLNLLILNTKADAAHVHLCLVKKIAHSGRDHKLLSCTFIGE